MNIEHRTPNIDRLVKSYISDGFVKKPRSRLASRESERASRANV